MDSKYGIHDPLDTSDVRNLEISLAVYRCGRMIYVRLRMLREVCESWIRSTIQSIGC